MSDDFPVIPGYQILKQMGQGGMATVYLAVQESFGRQVALKIMSDQLGKDDVWAKRFMHEARIVAQLSHSNIVPVFDVGSHNGRFYISMELLKGGRLEERMANGLPVPEAIKIVCGVAAGLDYAGSKGFVHRDIKPDNIMFRDDGTPVILDFGIAKQKDGESKMTKTGTIVGTTGYMSPEQAMGQELDERSDIYSLGIMLYELLTGSVPFHGDSAVAVLLKHVQEIPPPLPDNLNAFQPVMDKALAKKPEARYQRANEMIEYLQESLAVYKLQHPTNNKTSVPQASINPTAATVVMSAPVATAPAKKKRFSRTTVIVLAIVILLLLGALRSHHKKLAENAVTPVPPTTNPVTATTPEPVSTPVVPAPAVVDSTPVEQKPVVTTPETKIPPVTSVAKSASKHEVAPAPVSTPVAAAAPATTSEPADDATTPAATTEDNGNRRAVMRILMGARACMRNQQYDCAKSKAEAALDLEPDNENAKRILANAKKAQQNAFNGNWNAK